MIPGERRRLTVDPVDCLRRNFLAACHLQDDAVPVSTSSIVDVNAGHSEDYPPPTITDYLDEGLEAAQLVPCREIRQAIGNLSRDPAHYRAFWAAGMLDLVRNPLTAEEAARRLRLKSVSRLYQMRREFSGEATGQL